MIFASHSHGGDINAVRLPTDLCTFNHLLCLPLTVPLEITQLLTVFLHPQTVLALCHKKAFLGQSDELRAGDWWSVGSEGQRSDVDVI